MAYRKLEDTEKKVIQAVQKLGAENGIKGVTVKKVSELCDISTFTVATCFGNMQGALDAAKKDFETRYLEKVYQLVDGNHSPEDAWDEILDLYFEDPNGAVFYYEYNHYFGIDISAHNDRILEHLKVSKRAFASDKKVSDQVYLMIENFITAQSLAYARRIIKGYMERTAEGDKLMKTLIFGSIHDII